MKDERIDECCDDLDGGFRQNDRGNMNSGKEKMKRLGTRIYSSRTNSEGGD